MTTLGGMRLKSLTPCYDDPPVMASVLVRDVVATIKRYKVEPVGSLSCFVTENRFTDDEAVRWEFRPEATA